MRNLINFSESSIRVLRPYNLLMVVCCMLFMQYGLLKYLNVPTSLNHFQFSLLIVAVTFITAAGYIINDLMDVEIDAINHPKRKKITDFMSESGWYNIYFLLNVSAVGIGYYLSKVVQRPIFIILFILLVTLLYFYSTTLKRIPLLGNISVSISIGYALMFIPFFNLIPATYEGNQAMMHTYFIVFCLYALFAVLVTFIREIVKDQEDIKGDYNNGISSLPILLGQKRTSKIIAILCLFTAGSMGYLIQFELLTRSLTYLSLYLICTVISLLCYAIIKSWTASINKHYTHISHVLKLVLIFGMISAIVLAINLKLNASI